MVEQNARRCLQVCDRGYVLDQGRNAYTDTGSALMNDPKVIELYLGTLARPPSTAFSGLSGVIRRSVTPLGPLNAVPPRRQRPTMRYWMAASSILFCTLNFRIP